MRRAARKDDNHAHVVATLRKAGCYVVDVSGVACGTDLFVYAPRLGRWLSCEIKDGAKVPSARKLTPIEERHNRECRARGAPHEIVLSGADALEACGVDVGVI